MYNVLRFTFTSVIVIAAVILLRLIFTAPHQSNFTRQLSRLLPLTYVGNAPPGDCLSSGVISHGSDTTTVICQHGGVTLIVDLQTGRVFEEAWRAKSLALGELYLVWGNAVVGNTSPLGWVSFCWPNDNALAYAKARSFTSSVMVVVRGVNC